MDALLAEKNHDNIRFAVHGLQDLPAISPMASKLLNVIGDENITIHQLAEIIRQDASLGARIIGLANSAYFGQCEPITSVEDAIFKALGLRLTQNMALGIVLSGPFNSGLQCAAFDRNSFWLKAVLTASLAQGFCHLLEDKNLIDADTAYLAGLLNEFGLMPLVYLFPEQMDTLFARRSNGEHLHDILRKELGTDQHEVGAYLARKWKVPADVIDVIAHFSEQDYEGENKLLVQLIRFCSQWVTQYMENENWDSLPQNTDVLLECSGLEREQVLKLFKQQHEKSTALESMAKALAEN